MRASLSRCGPETQPSALPLGWVVGDRTGLGTMCWRGAALVEYFRKPKKRVVLVLVLRLVVCSE